MNCLKKLFSSKKLSKPENKPPRHFRNERFLAFASREVGTVEWRDGSNPKVEKYLDYGASIENTDSGLTDDVPWCAGFIAYCLESVGMGSTNSLAARSYLKWGVSTKENPLPGDIAVFWRGSISGWQGHVAIYLGADHYLGGNQNDSVNVTKYSKDRLLDIRRSSKHEKMSQADIDLLWGMATKVIAGNKVEIGGKVS